MSVGEFVKMKEEVPVKETKAEQNLTNGDRSTKLEDEGAGGKEEVNDLLNSRTHLFIGYSC